MEIYGTLHAHTLTDAVAAAPDPIHTTSRTACASPKRENRLYLRVIMPRQNGLEEPDDDDDNEQRGRDGDKTANSREDEP